MAWFDVSFSQNKTGLATVGYRQYNDVGGDAVARTTTGVVEIGNGAYGVVVVPDIDAEGFEWDTGEVVGKIQFAHEDISHVEEFPIGVAVDDFPVIMIDDTDHITPTPGLTVTGEIAVDGGGFVALTNGASDQGNGLYWFDLTAAEMNAEKVVLQFTATDADPQTIVIFTNRD